VNYLTVKALIVACWTNEATVGALKMRHWGINILGFWDRVFWCQGFLGSSGIFNHLPPHWVWTLTTTASSNDFIRLPKCCLKSILFLRDRGQASCSRFIPVLIRPCTRCPNASSSRLRTLIWWVTKLAEKNFRSEIGTLYSVGDAIHLQRFTTHFFDWISWGKGLNRVQDTWPRIFCVVLPNTLKMLQLLAQRVGRDVAYD